MNDAIQIRRAEWSDRERIFAFYKNAYSDWEQRIPERWDWQITNNPFRPEGPPPVWLAVDEKGQVIGQSMAVFEPMYLGGATVLSGWSVDFHVLAPYRGLGIGRHLRERMNQDLDHVLSIMMSAATRHIHEALGTQALPVLEEYLLNTDPAHLTQSLALQHPGWIGKVIRTLRSGYPISGYVNRQNRRRRGMAVQGAPDLEFVPVAQFPPELDALWQSLQPRFTGAVIRKAAYLNWKYGAQPHVDYMIFLIYEKDSLAGYLVLREKSGKGFVVDMLLDPEKKAAIFKILDFAVAYFSRRGVQEVRAGSAYPPYQECLRRIGWAKPVRTLVPMVKSRLVKKEDSEATAHWLFGLGDHDMQQ